MEKVELKKERDNSLNLKTLGLKLEVNPYWLIKEMINQNSQKIIDEMIESKYKEALNAFSSWQSRLADGFISDDDERVEFAKHHKEIHVQEIQNIADISRHLLMLQSDNECIELTEEQSEAEQSSFAYWRYNDFYGFEPTK